MENCGDLCDINDDCIMIPSFHIIRLNYIFNNYLALTLVEDSAPLLDLYF